MNIVTNDQYQIQKRLDTLIRNAKSKDEYHSIKELVYDMYQCGQINSGQLKKLKQSLLIQSAILSL